MPFVAQRTLAGSGVAEAATRLEVVCIDIACCFPIAPRHYHYRYH
jgi:hypothetical protein